MKLRENRDVTNFEEAVEEACRLHDILETEEEDQSSILSQQVEVLQIGEDSVNDTSYRRGNGHHGNAMSVQRDTSHSHSRGRGNRFQCHTYRPTNNRLPGSRSSSKGLRQATELRYTTPTDNTRQQYHENQSDRPGNARRSQGGRHRGVIRCYKCNQENHIARNCTLNH